MHAVAPSSPSSPPSPPLLLPATALASGLCLKVQERTQLVQQGSLKLQDDEPLITRAELIADPSQAEALVEPVLAFLRAHVVQWGWFYPPSILGLADSITLISKAGTPAGEILQGTTRGETTYLKARFHSFWEVQGGPVEHFQHPLTLERVVRYRLGLNNSKLYEYSLSDGTKVKRQETFDITFKNIRQGFVVQRHSASFFKPTTACSLYRRWLGSEERPCVWDPSCGFGARLLGFAVAYPKGKYIGHEPSSAIYKDLVGLARELHPLTTELHPVGSEHAKFNPESLDLVLTSPPYFDKEKYFDEPGQCWRDYPQLPSWIQGYLLPTLQAAFTGLKRGKHLVLNVDFALKDVILEGASRVGFRLVDEHRLLLGADHFRRKQGNISEKAEPILVFRKP